MECIEELVSCKWEIFSYYKENLEFLLGIIMNFELKGMVNGGWMLMVVFSFEFGIIWEKL